MSAHTCTNYCINCYYQPLTADKCSLDECVQAQEKCKDVASGKQLEPLRTAPSHTTEVSRPMNILQPFRVTLGTHRLLLSSSLTLVRYILFR